MTEQELEKLAELLAGLQSNPVGVWSVALGLFLTVLGLLAAFLQLRAIRIRLRDDHERSRRLTTLDAIRFHSDNARPEFNKAKTIFESLSTQELKKLYDAQRITIPKEQKEIVCAVLKNNVPSVFERYEKKRSAIELTFEESMHLRFLLVDFLNHIEACLLPWHLGVADKDEMETQFAALVLPDGENCKPRLEDARNVVGIEKFPATQAFIARVCEAKSAPPPKEPLAK